MLHPVGSLPPSVYWRRRVYLLAAVVAAVVLVVLTVRAVKSGGSAATASTPPSTSHSSSTASHASTPPASTGSSSGASSGQASTTTSSSAPSSPSSAACLPAQLKIAAAAQAPTYKVGDEPVVMLQVTNIGTANCTEDLADPKIELRVYNGAARVWGSHDCKIQPGTDVETLVPGTTVAKAIQWSGLTSQPDCAGTRQRVGAGTYTVYALLDGTQGTAAQFTIS